MVSDSWFQLSVLTNFIWGGVNAVGTFFSTMFYGVDAVAPRRNVGISSTDYRGRQSGMSNVKSMKQFKAPPPS